jgi:hypothetical protein
MIIILLIKMGSTQSQELLGDAIQNTIKKENHHVDINLSYLTENKTTVTDSIGYVDDKLESKVKLPIPTKKDPIHIRTNREEIELNTQLKRLIRINEIHDTDLKFLETKFRDVKQNFAETVEMHHHLLKSRSEICSDDVNSFECIRFSKLEFEFSNNLLKKYGNK